MSGHVAFVKLLLDSGASMTSYPFGNSWDGFLDWAERYCAVKHEQMQKIRALFDAARIPQIQPDSF
jgi:hypothetical protein